MRALSSTQLEQIINHMPIFPQVVQRAIEAIDSEEVSQAEVAEIITQDPMLVTQFLSLANSPFYGLSGKIVSIQHACIILGLHTIRSALMALGVMRLFPEEGKGFYDRKALWQHAFGVAGIARFLAEYLHLDQGTAFTAGLLHDIGKLVLDECCADRLPEVIRYRQDNDCSEYEAERAVLGVDHAVLGAKLVGYWKLPEELADIIAGHHRAGETPGQTALVEVVGLSNSLYHSLQVIPEEEVVVPQLSDSCSAWLDITSDQIREWLPELDVLIKNAMPSILTG